MVYLDARSQCGSTHGSTSDDTGSSMSTVVDRLSTSDRVSTISTASTASTASEQPSEFSGIDRDLDRSSDQDVLLSRAICPLEHLERDFPANPPDYLLRRLANSEAVTHVESRGEVERITAVVAPNTVLIEETITLQPPLSFQDAPLSYGHEARPDLFYTADLAADSTTHFRPIKDDVELVERVNGNGHEEFREATCVTSAETCERSNGDRLSTSTSSSSSSSSSSPPPLPARNHVNRICVNQSTSELANEPRSPRVSATVPASPEREPPDAPLLPPKPLPRKDVKARRKRPPPPPPPPTIAPRREAKPSAESNHVMEKESGDLSQAESAEHVQSELCNSSPSRNNVHDERNRGGERSSTHENFDVEPAAKSVCADNEVAAAGSAEGMQTNKVFEIIEIRIAKDLQTNQKEEVARNEPDSASETMGNCERTTATEQSDVKDEVIGKNKQEQLQSSSNSSRIPTERPNPNVEATEKPRTDENDEEGKYIDSERTHGEKTRVNTRDVFKEGFSSNGEVDNPALRESEDDETYQSLDEVNDDMKSPEMNRMLEDEEIMEEEEDTSDESDDGDYYWQSNLATIGEEEETNSLEYMNA